MIEPDFPARYREPDGHISPVMDICKSSAENIAIVGEGGIGKTTFLHQLMRGEFLDGFNEVKPGEGLSVQAMLSNEISILNTYQNVRIITTSSL